MNNSYFPDIIIILFSSSDKTNLKSDFSREYTSF